MDLSVDRLQRLRNSAEWQEVVLPLLDLHLGHAINQLLGAKSDEERAIVQGKVQSLREFRLSVETAEEPTDEPADVQQAEEEDARRRRGFLRSLRAWRQ